MADVSAVPGEVDDGTVNFSDLPGRKRYKVVLDVPCMTEHLMKGDSDTPEQYVGPDILRLIAAHNNARVHQTGDATPIVIGHTKDLAPEANQPPIVGFACNFRVHRLLNKDVQAIHADFHLMEEKLDEIANYPRRSVELWPKRWEIDPIALLGATTPEQDLGLLMLSRPGTPRRYRRIFEDDNMADDKAKKKDAANGGPSVPGDSGIVQELIQAFQNPDVMKLITGALLETAPFKELLAEAGEGEGASPDAAGAAPPMSPEGAPPEGDMPMGAGPEGAGMGGGPEDGPPMAGAGMGGPPMPGGMGAGGPPGPDPESAYYHEGPPERYMGADCGPMDYEMDGGGGGGYPSATGGFIPGEGGYGMREPRHYEDYYAPQRRHPMRQSYSRDGYAAGYVDPDERYARYLEDQERRMQAQMRPPAPRPAQPPARPAQTSAIPPERKQQLQQTDVAVRMSRLEKELGELREQNKKLQRDKTIADRSLVLQSLQAEGVELDVATEIEDVVDLTEDAFSKHVERIKRSYSRAPVGFKPVQPVDRAPVTRGGREERMSQEDRVQYQREIGAKIAAAQAHGEKLTYDEAKQQVDGGSNGVVKTR